MSKIFKALTEGISSQELADVLFSRLIYRFPDIVSKYGHEYLGDVIADVASFHEGAEELGSSDINIMIREIMNKLTQLDETTTPDNDEIVSYGVYIMEKPLLKFDDFDSLKQCYLSLKEKYPSKTFIVKKTVTTTSEIDHQTMLEGLQNPKDNPTWRGYQPVGIKKKHERNAPNCVPKESAIMKGLQK